MLTLGLTNLKFVLCCGRNTDKMGNIINDCYVPYSFRIEEIKNNKFGEIYTVEYILSKTTSKSNYSEITYEEVNNLKFLSDEIKNKLDEILLV